ncbi:MAG: hypothetical protein KDA78_05055 [Planctomycetaceae bacterium]|nr:hypothetical protein [Planctomycetaceae bacterium]
MNEAQAKPSDSTEDPVVNSTELEQEVPEGPSSSQLIDRTPEWFRISRRSVLWTVVVGMIFLCLSYHRTWHTDVWGHLAYGRLIVETGHLPVTEPFLPLSEGIPVVDTAWLTQCLAYLLVDQVGVSALRFLYAAAITLCVIALLIRFRQHSSSFGIPLLGITIFGLTCWKTLTIDRPQLAGLACYVLIWSILLSRRWNGLQWVGVPALFALWANLHGSFPMGLILLGLLTVGTFFDQYRRTGKCWRWPAVRLLLLTELSLIATLLNPYGIGLIPAVIDIARDPNLQALGEWGPLTLSRTQGQGLAIVSMLLILLYRFSPRRISASEPLLLFTFALAGMASIRLLIWWTPIAAWYGVLHGNACLNRWNRWLERTTEAPDEQEAEEITVQTSGFNTVVALGLGWIFFAYTPFMATLLHGQPNDPERQLRYYRANLDSGTPVLLANYLNAHEPQGLIFNAYEWGDYLLWTGPETRRLFLNSHAHLLPAEVWDDYFIIARGQDGWDDKLDRYGVNTIVIDHLYRTRLIEMLKRDERWTLDYQDDLGAIFLRKKPIVHSF